MKKTKEPLPSPSDLTQDQNSVRAGTLSLDEVFDLCGGIHLQAHDRALYAIVTALTKIPAEVVRAVAKSCYIIVPSMQEKGSFTDQSIVGGRHVIAFPEALFESQVDEIEKTVLHEVAHFWLGHKLNQESGRQSAEDLDRQEEEADEQVAQWLH